MNACFCAFKLLRRDNNSNTITAFYNLIRENYKDDDLIAALNREIRLDTQQYRDRGRHHKFYKNNTADECDRNLLIFEYTIGLIYPY